ncbi:MAG: hypothetical protein KJ061_15250 [Vicinamibacteraceae bacterium]|nr:hypothetical protein [Vicinamibacteraceae bacterium]
MADSPSVPALACQRCNTMMELRDPAPGAPWTPVQYWVCTRCGRHFWTTYPPPAAPKAAEAAAPAKAAEPAAGSATGAAPATPVTA